VKERLARLDRYQQRHRWLGFPIAVGKKFGEDQAANLAALISYYAFFSFFPLLLVLVTTLGFVVAGSERVEDQVLGTVFAQFPGLGHTIAPSVQHLTGNGFGLAVGLVLALWAGLSVGNAAQDGFNTVWQVPIVDRPGLARRTVRSAGLLAVLGGNIVSTTVISALSSGAGSLGFGLGAGARLALLAGSLVINVVLFTVSFRLLTVRDVSTRAVLPGAVLAAVGWQILQWVGGYFITSRLQTASAAYGTFAIVIGLLTWFFLLGQLVLLAAELNVVRARKLWPRGLVDPPVTDADRRVFQGHAAIQRFVPGTRVEVHFGAGQDPERTGPSTR
jgi:membrane protein